MPCLFVIAGPDEGCLHALMQTSRPPLVAAMMPSCNWLMNAHLVFTAAFSPAQ